MKCLGMAAAAAVGALIAANSDAQSSKKIAAFDDLLESVHFIQNYREISAVSARVYGARGQGSDREFAAFSAKVVTADLASYQACVSRAYAAGPLTEADALELARLFRTPLRERIAEVSQRALIAGIEAGSNKPADSSFLSDEERKQLLSEQAKPAYVRYAAFITSAEYRQAAKTCLKDEAIKLGFKP